MHICLKWARYVPNFSTCNMDMCCQDFMPQCPEKPQEGLTYAIIAHIIGLLDINQPMAHGMFSNVFATREIPAVSPSEYALFLFESFQCSSSTALYTFIYLERAARAHHDVQMTPYTVHRLLLSAFVVACKYVEDRRFSMQAFSHVGGVTLKDLLILELSFMKLTCYQFYVSQETFDMCELLVLAWGHTHHAPTPPPHANRTHLDLSWGERNLQEPQSF